jgi:hypothetical protein
MEKVFIILKIISLLHPNKVWDKVSHFLYTTQDREIMKQYRKSKLFSVNFDIKKRDLTSTDMLSIDRKSVVNLYVGPKYLWNHTFKNLWKPHEDKGIWKVEVLTEEKIISYQNSGPYIFYSDKKKRVMKKKKKKKLEEKRSYDATNKIIR